jgi:hypothetical protein
LVFKVRKENNSFWQNLWSREDTAAAPNSTYSTNTNYMY